MPWEVARALAALSILVGGASQYDPGVMDIVIENRQHHKAFPYLPDPLPAVDGYVAVVDCDKIGSLLLARPVGSEAWESFLIVDCAGPQLRLDSMTGGEWMRANNILIEIDHETAVRWDTVGRGIQVEVFSDAATTP